MDVRVSGARGRAGSSGVRVSDRMEIVGEIGRSREIWGVWGYARGDSWIWARLSRAEVEEAGGKKCIVGYSTPWARVGALV